MSAKTQMQEHLRTKITHAAAALEIAKGTLAVQNWIVTSPRPGMENFVVTENDFTWHNEVFGGPVPTFALEDANRIATNRVLRDGEGSQIPLEVMTPQAFHSRLIASYEDAIALLDTIPE